MVCYNVIIIKSFVVYLLSDPNYIHLHWRPHTEAEAQCHVLHIYGH